MGNKKDILPDENVDWQAFILEQAVQNGSLFGIVVLAFGIATALLNFSRLLIHHLFGRQFNIWFAITQAQNSPLTLDRIKLELARMISFSLLLLGAVDILETITKPGKNYEMEELYKMALRVGIRITLAYFLGKEIEEIMLYQMAISSAHYDFDEEDETLSRLAVDETSKSKPQGLVKMTSKSSLSALKKVARRKSKAN